MDYYYYNTLQKHIQEDHKYNIINPWNKNQYDFFLQFKQRISSKAKAMGIPLSANLFQTLFDCKKREVVREKNKTVLDESLLQNNMVCLTNKLYRIYHIYLTNPHNEVLHIEHNRVYVLYGSSPIQYIPIKIKMGVTDNVIRETLVNCDDHIETLFYNCVRSNSRK